MTMKTGRFSSFTSLALTALVCLALITIFEWVDRLIWPDISHQQHRLHFSLFITSACCIAAFFILRYLDARAALASIVQSSEDGIIGKDLEGRIIFWNGGAERIYGYSREEVKGKPISILMPSEGTDDISSILEKIKRGESVAHFETVHFHKGGSRVPVSLTVSPVRNAVGSISGASTIVRDITERKRMEAELMFSKSSLEEEVRRQTQELVQTNTQLMREIDEREQAEATLRESELKYRNLSQEFDTLLNAISDTLVLISPEMKVLWTNNGTAYHSDAPLDELIGNCCHDLFYGRRVPCEDCPVVRSFQTGGIETHVSSRSGRFLDKRAFPIKDGNEVRSIILLVSDITEKMRMQAESMLASHLASLGELAAGVAHEINNPINGIINYAQILINESLSDTLEHDIAGRIVKEGERVAAIVSSLLSFARGGTEEKSAIRLEVILRETLPLIQAQLRKDSIRLDIRVPDGLPEIEGNFQQIQQVFLNILNNARYALNEKYPGRNDNKSIDIRGDKVILDGREHVRTSFVDHGVGIPAEELSMLTKPFFSTKPFGRGTGLGLSITSRIVMYHGGRLAFESEEGEYTKVMIDLPVKANKDA
jgi:PAS domain S-box-containing protein